MNTTLLPGVAAELRERVACEILRLRVQRALLDTSRATGHTHTQRARYGHLGAVSERITSPRRGLIVGTSLTAHKKRMPYFSRSAAMGRPLTVPVAAFTAIMLAKLHGLSRKRATELLSEDPDAATPLMWHLAAQAHAQGITTAEDFETWVKVALSEEIKAPIV